MAWDLTTHNIPFNILFQYLICKNFITQRVLQLQLAIITLSILDITHHNVIPLLCSLSLSLSRTHALTPVSLCLDPHSTLSLFEFLSLPYSQIYTVMLAHSRTHMHRSTPPSLLLRTCFSHITWHTQPPYTLYWQLAIYILAEYTEWITSTVNYCAIILLSGNQLIDHN